jgi:preprotein translocase subunit SecD
MNFPSKQKEQRHAGDHQNPLAQLDRAASIYSPTQPDTGTLGTIQGATRMPKIKSAKAEGDNAENSMELTFNFERETKGAVRFQEVIADGEEKRIGTLYVRKSVFGSNVPKSLAVTITY